LTSKLDETDLRILNELQQNSGRPIHELADVVGISMPSCARRVKKLEQDGVIVGYVALLSPDAVGLDLDVFVSIRLRTQTLKAMADFRKLVSAMPEVVECYALTGDSDFILHVRMPGVKEFNVWMQSKLIGMSTIFTTHSSISLERVKYSTALPILESCDGTSSPKKPAKRRSSR